MSVSSTGCIINPCAQSELLVSFISVGFWGSDKCCRLTVASEFCIGVKISQLNKGWPFLANGRIFANFFI